MTPSKSWSTRFKLSYSEKRDITTCPHRYELISIQKIQTVDASIVRRLLVANSLDSSLDTWVKQSFTGSLEEIAVTEFNSRIKSAGRYIQWKSATDARECELNLRRGAVNLAKGMQEADMCRSDVETQPHVKAILKLSDGQEIKLTGRLDLLYRDEPSVWDLKTTENVKWLDLDQLIYYDLAMSLQLGRKVKRCGFLVPLLNPPVQEIPAVGKDQWNRLIEELNQAIQHIHNSDYPATGDPSKDCFMCFAKKFCKRNVVEVPSVVYVGDSMRTQF